MDRRPRSYRQFSKDHARLFEAYESLGALAAKAGPLDGRTRELVKLGMAAALRAESAVKSHTHRALEAGVTFEEIEHALLVGVTTMGFPAMMSALTWAQQAAESHEESG
jgi:AhpD family alkylhydroperoxidase